jgi:hypothetical protein
MLASPCPNMRKTTGSARTRSPDVSMKAKRKSFHDAMNTNSPAPTRPGRASGTATCAIAPTRMQPSIWAASSRSRGSAAK